ncbi:microfibril-associated glycoprotein 4-like [Asterias amurensis]|uniref:microfibril-associated glycoprotein 4-like n=1 Tax=Asterias amurensis TaxID=7602 RepID=UPI003AB80ECD
MGKYQTVSTPSMSKAGRRDLMFTVIWTVNLLLAADGRYDAFRVTNEINNYTLTIAGFKGTSKAVGDSMIEHNGMPWSTYDNDNDNAEGNCAEIYHGAWWYNDCQTSNLNGPYRSYRYLGINEKGITWESWTGTDESLRDVDMKIIPLRAAADPRPNDCWDHFQNGQRSNGIYTIFLKGKTVGVDVYCHMDSQSFSGGGWTKIQNRDSGNVEFYRDWTEYKTGFGNLNGEFWLGLENIHLLTSQDDYQLRVVLAFDNSDWTYAVYDSFHVSDEKDNYTLTIGTFTGRIAAGDSMIEHNGMPWSTYDNDNDNGEGNCAEIYHGAWWYNDCQTSNLNGPYQSYRYLGSNENGITWESWTGTDESLGDVDMKIRPLRAGN